MRVVVLGSGAWGTALAVSLCEGGHSVVLWGRDADALRAMQTDGRNARYLPGVDLPESLEFESNAARAMCGSEVCVLALPSTALRETAQRGDPAFSGLAICASKGFEKDTGRTLDEVIADIWPAAPVVLLSGPTFAIEIAQGKPAAAVAASKEPSAAQRAHELLSNDRFRVYTSRDVVGVAVGGALKNVIAIAAGCSDALGFGFNARAALITRGLSEMGRLAEKLGGDPMTLAGLAGLGDLVLTCTGELSRNRTVGFALGRGEHLRAVEARLGQVAEGVESAATALRLAERVGVDMPITREVANVLRGESTPREAVVSLLQRDVAGPEW